MHSIVNVLKSVSVWHYFVLLTYASIEYWLPRTSKVEARSVLEAVANGIGIFFPWVKEKAGSPSVDSMMAEKPKLPPTITKAS